MRVQDKIKEIQRIWSEVSRVKTSTVRVKLTPEARLLRKKLSELGLAA